MLGLPTLDDALCQGVYIETACRGQLLGERASALTGGVDSLACPSQLSVVCLIERVPLVDGRKDKVDSRLRWARADTRTKVGLACSR